MSGEDSLAMTTMRFEGPDINGEAISCTVQQLLLILDELVLSHAIAECVWYGADIQPAIGPLSRHDSRSPIRIGESDVLDSLLRSLPFPQIDFGVFAAFRTDAVPLNEVVSAEGPPGRKRVGSIVELAAIDDTYIEVTSDHDEIIRRLRIRFPTGKVLHVDQQGMAT